MISKYVKGKVYVFIDAANLENSVKSLNWWVDYQKLYNYLKKESCLIEIRHYCARFDAKNQDKFFTVLKKAGFRIITKPLKIIKGRNSGKADFDVEIALDAYRFRGEYDTLILFSGDSDFDFLLRLLRQDGKRVVVVSAKHHISKELINRAHKYIDLVKLKSFIERLF